jgi:hypothetical protein
MAPRSQTSAAQSTKRAPKRSVNGRSTRSARAVSATQTRSRRKATDIGELERVIRSLEERLARLTDDRQIRSTISGATGQVGRVVASASDHVGDMVADTLTDVAGRFRAGATSVTDAAKAGTNAMHRIGVELERRPLMTVAIALGIGFLAGIVGRRDPSA